VDGVFVIVSLLVRAFAAALMPKGGGIGRRLPANPIRPPQPA